jgi:hypothetical protein
MITIRLKLNAIKQQLTLEVRSRPLQYWGGSMFETTGLRHIVQFEATVDMICDWNLGWCRTSLYNDIDI